MKKKYKIYVTSQIAVSQEMPEFVKDMLHREDCFYRVSKPEELLTKREKRESQEMLRKTVTLNGPNGEKRDVPFVEFDWKGKRYFLEINDLSQLFEFSSDLDEHCDYGFSIQHYDPADDDDADYLEAKFGLEMPAGYVLEIKDILEILEPDFEEVEEDE